MLIFFFFFFFFKQKTAYEISVRDWSSDVCSSDLDLEAGVYLEEVEGARGVQDELDGAGVVVADRPSRGDRRGAHPPPALVVERRRRRLLDDLLMTALDRALALEAVDERPVHVAEDLDLHVPRRADVAFDEERIVAEGALRLAPRRLECRPE